MQFTKLFNSILDSTIWQESAETKIVWITMLAMCDRYGDVFASIPGLAARSGVTVSQCECAITCFLSPDKYSRTKDHEGRRIKEIDGGWNLLNHGKYRELLSAEERKEYNRRKQAEYRASKKDAVNDMSNNVKDCSPLSAMSTHTEAEAEAEAEADTKAKAKAEKKNTPKGDEDELFEYWNTIAESIPALPKIAKVTSGRRAKAKSRLAEPFFRENWKTAMDTIKDRPFLQGHNQRGWIADIDWFLQPDAVIKIAEGKYKNDAPQPHQPTREPVRDVYGNPVIPKPPKTYDDVED